MHYKMQIQSYDATRGNDQGELLTPRATKLFTQSDYNFDLKKGKLNVSSCLLVIVADIDCKCDENRK